MTSSLIHGFFKSVMFNFKVLGDFADTSVVHFKCFVFYFASAQYALYDFISFKYVTVCLLAQYMVFLGHCSCTLESNEHFPVFEQLTQVD